MTYEVQTPVYAGPFDLLLHLILREQVDLYEVSLIDIVDAYLAELDRMEQPDLDSATEFLLIAATLVEMKAKSLLPDEADTDLDDELAMWEHRDVLLARLVECKTFKEAAAALAHLAGIAGLSSPRLVGPDDRFVDVVPDILEGVVAADIKKAFLRAATPKPVLRIDLDHVAPIRISVTDAVNELANELPQAGEISFRALTAQLVDRIDIIVHFLAVLELFKQGAVAVTQVDAFGDIVVAWQGEQHDGWSPGLGAVDSYEG
jgi:segregation and condensation protein A